MAHSTSSKPVTTNQNHQQDRTIIGVAVPAISNEFQSFSDISWYESGYLLTFAALQLPMGKIYVSKTKVCPFSPPRPNHD